jgi:hypothetical protein
MASQLRFETMTHKPKRQSPTVTPFEAEGCIWSTLGAYAKALAPVTGPLLEAIGEVADAIERVGRQNRALEPPWEQLEEE